MPHSTYNEQKMALQQLWLNNKNKYKQIGNNEKDDSSYLLLNIASLACYFYKDVQFGTLNLLLCFLICMCACEQLLFKKTKKRSKEEKDEGKSYGLIHYPPFLLIWWWMQCIEYFFFILVICVKFTIVSHGDRCDGDDGGGRNKQHNFM